jgi:hypothetical protein
MSIQNNFPAIKPTLLLDFANVKQLDPRITFTRASTATFYDGRTVAKAEENLLTQSGNVSIWTQAFGLGSITANATTAPDGTTTAGFVPVDSGTSRHFVGSQRGGIAAIGATITGSVFLKASTYGFASVQLSNATVSAGTPRYAISVDLSNGTIGGFTGNTGVSGQTASAVSVGNGWYRVILTMTTTNAGDGAGMNILVTPMPTNGSGYSDGGAILPSFTGDGTSGIFVWGAQAEQRSTATAYTATTTAPITNYIPVLLTAASGVARFQHDPITDESLGLLIEEQRTNLLNYSEQLDNAAWTKVNATVAANTVVAPDGALTADTQTRSSTAASYIVQSITKAASSIAYTLSVFAKASVGDFIALQIQGTFPARAWAVFNIRTGAISTAATAVTFTSPSATITSVGNGWYRVTVTATSDTATTLGSYVSFNSNNIDINGTDSASNSAGFIWGAQLEAGAFATSYTPTVASQVTRSADAASMTGTNFTSWYSQSEGTLYGEANAKSSGAFLEANNGTSNERLAISIDGTNSRLAGVDANAGTYYAIIYSVAGTAPLNTSNKGAFAYKVNDFALSANANTVATDTGGLVANPTQLRVGSSGLGATGEYLNGTIKKIAYYPLRVTNAQLQALTTV